MTIIDDYLSLQEEQVKKYGENTLVLMQVGHFFESYAVDNEKEKSNAENIYKLADIMNIQITRKNKSIVESSRGNPVMIGINLCSKDKYIQILLNAGYTIVMVEQVTDPPEPKREITNIYSPGTNLEYNVKNSSNNLMCIYIESVPNDSSKMLKNIGMSVIDFTTGKNSVYEVYSNISNKDYNYSLDEVYRFIQVYNPCEILIIYSDINKYLCEDYLTNYLNLGNTIVHYKDKTSVNKEYDKLEYQRQFLEKIFKKDSVLSIIEYLDLERSPLATISYIHLLDFAYIHNEEIVKKINKPDIFKSENYLLLTNNSINQLNVISNDSSSIYNSLFSVINKTSTSIGRRMLRDQLLNPIINSEELNKRYDYVQFMYDNDRHIGFEKYLNKITDLERIHRRLSLGILQPTELFNLDYSYIQVLGLFELENHGDLLPNKDIIESFNHFINEYNTVFNMDVIIKYNIDTINESIFNRNIDQAIDDIDDNIHLIKDKLDAICRKFSKLLNQEIDTYFKLEYSERDGYSLYATSNRCKSLKSAFNNMHHKPIHLETVKGHTFDVNIAEITFKTTSVNKSKLTSPLISELCSEYRILKMKIGVLCKDVFIKYLTIFDTNYSDTLKGIANYIGRIDVYKSVAKVSHMYGYNRPTISEELDSSFIDALEIRHPIIERIQTKTEYVTNDLSIGKESQTGILLYGTNASGKSSLMKAIGLNIILAQSGFFTASKSFIYKPYRYLFTRILNNDNIFKGESSFAVEMSELRSILKRTNCNSLVLGDELCSGTENISAQSIFASTIITLSKKASSFIFATHLHGLNNMDCIRELENVNSYHLKVIFNKDTGELIYDRKIQDGNGPTIYGLEVCKAMDLDSEFVELADTIRRDLLNMDTHILEVNKSKYNANIIVDLCEICSEKAEDTHHIKFQCTANNDNIIQGHITKNIESNLVPLCKKCHNEVHHGTLTILGYIETSNGIKLNYRYNNEKVKPRKKFSDKVDFIKKLYSEQNVSYDTCRKLLEKNHDIEISIGTLKKIIIGTY